MTAKINSKIVGYKVLAESEQVVDIPVIVEPDKLNEATARPELLFGSTYKIKPVGMDDALYIIINDIEVNGEMRPYEIFINTKSIESIQWVMIFTRLVSAIWRNGGNHAFMVEEMKNTFDPKGGYFLKGNGLIPSIVAHIGIIIDKHLKSIESNNGLILADSRRG